MGMQPPSENPGFAGRVSLVTQSRVGAMQVSSLLSQLIGIQSNPNEADLKKVSDPGRPPTTKVDGVVMSMGMYRGWNVWRMAPQKGRISKTPITTRATTKTIVAVHGGS